MPDEMKPCPWCGRTAKLVMVMYFTDAYSVTERVCMDCRRAWLKKMKKAVGA